jgi:hypothetical protein
MSCRYNIRFLMFILHVFLWFSSVLDLIFVFQITELVHQRDVTRMLVANKVNNPKNFDWLCQMRFYFDPKNSDALSFPIHSELTLHHENVYKILKLSLKAWFNIPINNKTVDFQSKSWSSIRCNLCSIG